MKKLLLLIVLFSLVFFLPAIIDLDNHPSAQQGCCLERDSLSSDNWYQNGLSFRKCRDLNERRDGDDLYSRRGYIYWDEGC